MPKKKKEVAKLTKAEKLGIKFVLVAIPALAVYGFILGQQDYWAEVKEQKAHERMIMERNKALDESLNDVKPVRLWREKTTNAVYVVKPENEVERARLIAEVWNVKGDGNIKQLTQLLKQ